MLTYHKLLILLDNLGPFPVQENSDILKLTLPTNNPSQPENFPNRRKNPRVKHGGYISFKTNLGKPGKGVVRDVSEGGIFFTSDTPVTVGTEIMIYLPLEFPKKKPLCVVSGLVVRVSSPKEAKGFGVKFNPSSSSIAKILQEYVTFKITGAVAKDKSEPEKKATGRVSAWKD